MTASIPETPPQALDDLDGDEADALAGEGVEPEHDLDTSLFVNGETL